jgi:hypothetical protein
MTQSIKNRCASLSNKSDAVELRKTYEAVLADLTALRATVGQLVTDASARSAILRNHLVTAPVLAIGGGAKKSPQATKGFFAIFDGAWVYTAAATAMPALTGAQTAADKSIAYAFYISSTGTITVSARTADAANPAAAIALINAVAIPAGLVLIGWLVVTMSGGAQFTPDTTALDAANTASLYFDAIGLSKDPGALTASAPAALSTVA